MGETRRYKRYGPTSSGVTVEHQPNATEAANR